MTVKMRIRDPICEIHSIAFSARSVWRPILESAIALVLVVGSVDSNAFSVELPTSHLVGHEKCGECHESELATWLASPHALKSLAMVDPRNRRFNPKAERIVNSFLAKDKNASKKTCMKCHDTQHIQNGELVTLKGVSCESCHGPAGNLGDNPGWVDLHYDCDDQACDVQDNAKQREIKRVTFLEGIGMRHPKNIYGILKSCVKCHSVSDEDVVRAGHPTGRIDFEYLSWFRDDLEHESSLVDENDEQNSQHKACLKFIVGQLVDLEVSLKNRGTAETRGYSTAAATRVAAAHNMLKRVYAAEQIPDVEWAIQEVDQIYPALFASPGRNQNHFFESGDRISNIADRLSGRLSNRNISKIEELLPTQPTRFSQLAGPNRDSVLPSYRRVQDTAMIEAAHVEGATVCVRCHQAEYTSWTRSSHAQDAFDELRTNPNSYVYAERLGIRMSELTTDSICVSCHATPQVDRSGRQIATAGVSCESCHGAAGGPQGWLNIHSAFGSNHNNRLDDRHANFTRYQHALKQAGMNTGTDIYELAKACYQCHIVTNERLVDLGGHKTGSFDFEWVKWFQGEARHNFHLNQQHNAEAPTNLSNRSSSESDKKNMEAGQRTAAKYIVGQMVDLEISLSNRAAASTLEFSNVAAGRIAAANSRLREINDVLQLDDLSAVNSQIEKLDSFLFTPPNSSLESDFQSAAEEIGRIAKAFAASFESHDLSGIAHLLPTSVKGIAYQP